jgi:uncharacterized membrane protein YkoI
MNIFESRAARLFGVLAIVGQLALLPCAMARTTGPAPVVPQGALAHAAMAVETDTGGKVLEIRLVDETGAPAFEAAISKGDALLYMRVGSVDETVTEIKVSNLPAWLVNYHLEAYMRSIDKAAVPLVNAIMRAEERASAPAIGAGLAKPLSGTNAVLAYYVETMASGKRQLFAIDAKSGAFISNPESLYEPHTPVKLARRLAS